MTSCKRAVLGLQSGRATTMDRLPLDVKIIKKEVSSGYLILGNWGISYEITRQGKPLTTEGFHLFNIVLSLLDGKILFSLGIFDSMTEFYIEFYKVIERDGCIHFNLCLSYDTVHASDFTEHCDMTSLKLNPKTGILSGSYGSIQLRQKKDVMREVLMTRV